MKRPTSINLGMLLLTGIALTYTVKTVLALKAHGGYGYLYAVTALVAFYSVFGLSRGRTFAHRTGALAAGVTIPYGLTQIGDSALLGIPLAAAGLVAVYLLYFPQGSRNWWTTHRTPDQRNADRLRVDF
ncbi:hypothetical protein [Kribbella lupini]|uniref:Uncharacterized protein n=1 Tax=Kribbella lupini TaxID=291602 RepID=A0ABN2AAN9_9ACTN